MRCNCIGWKTDHLLYYESNVNLLYFNLINIILELAILGVCICAPRTVITEIY